MTTIVYKDGIIAYDSRATNGGSITSDKVNKKEVVQKVAFFFCGWLGEFELLIAAYHDVDLQEDITSEGPCALVVDNGELFLCSLDADTKRFWKQSLKHFDEYAIGSGSEFARGAMSMGADAVTAVKVAAKLDTGTGGKIRTYKIRK